MVEEINYCSCGCGQIVKPGNKFIHNHHGCKEPWKPKSEPQLCECGCDRLTNPGKKFIHGHQNCKTPCEPKSEPQLCECGCGEYTKSGNKYINGHNKPMLGKKLSDQTIKKLRYIGLKRFEDPLEHEKARNVQLKRFEDPKEYEKAKERAIKIWNNPIHRENTKVAAIKRFEDPLEHEKVRDSANKRWKDPLEHEKARESAKNRWDDPLEHEKAREAQNKRYEDPIAHEKLSAGQQGIPYEEWEKFASNSLYCPDFNDECRESNRDKYDRMCFLTGLSEEENITQNGNQWKLSVHHVDMDKGQGCDGIKWKLVPICLKWHSKVHNEVWESRIIWLLNNVWNNKNN